MISHLLVPSERVLCFYWHICLFFWYSYWYVNEYSSLLPLNKLFPAHPRPQNLRNKHALLLVIVMNLQDAGQHSRYRQSGPIHSMRKFRFPLLPNLDPRIQSPSLVVRAYARRCELSPSAMVFTVLDSAHSRREECFDIPFSRG